MYMLRVRKLGSTGRPQIAETLDHIKILHLPDADTLNSFGSLYVETAPPNPSLGYFSSLHTLCLTGAKPSSPDDPGVDGLLQYLNICQIDGGLERLVVVKDWDELDDTTVKQIKDLVGEVILGTPESY